MGPHSYHEFSRFRRLIRPAKAPNAAPALSSSSSWFRWELIGTVEIVLFRFPISLPRRRLTLGAPPSGFYQNPLPLRHPLSLLTGSFNLGLFLATRPVDSLAADRRTRSRGRVGMTELLATRRIDAPHPMALPLTHML